MIALKNERVANLSLAAAARERALRVHARVPAPKREPRLKLRHIAAASLLVAFWLCADAAIDKVVAYAENVGRLEQYALAKQSEAFALREQLEAKDTPKRTPAERRMAAAVGSLNKGLGK